MSDKVHTIVNESTGNFERGVNFKVIAEIPTSASNSDLQRFQH